jgi:hypothetical protein
MTAAPSSRFAAEDLRAPQKERISGQSAVSLIGQSGIGVPTRLGAVGTGEALSAELTTQKLLQFRELWIKPVSQGQTLGSLFLWLTRGKGERLDQACLARGLRLWVGGLLL